MSVAKTPRLLFHGTSALAAYVSHQTGRALEAMHRKHPRKTLNLIDRDHLDSFFFVDLGAGYPFTGRSIQMTSKQPVCLTRSLIEASLYSRWEMHVFGENWLRMINVNNRRISLHGGLFANFPEVQAMFNSIVQAALHRAGGYNKSFLTPGAILCVDAPRLEQDRLFHTTRTGEEFGVADYLPWSHIRGALVVGTTGRGKVIGFAASDEKLIDDLNYTLENEYGGLAFAKFYLSKNLRRYFPVPQTAS